MGTNVQYGQVLLKNVQTRAWEEAWQFDESDTDALYAKYNLEFEGIIHANAALLAQTPPFNSAPAYTYGGSGTDAVSIYQQIRACLHEPRQLLTVTFNGQQVLRALHVDAGTDPDCDVRNGPKPRFVKLTHIANNVVFHVVFGIEVCKLECCVLNTGTAQFVASTTPPGLVLNNRWSVAEAMDSNFFTTRTIRGKLVCSQSMAANLNTLRPQIVPTLKPGFKRESIEFAVLPNGLEADYTVVDRQVHTAAPFPATRMQATFSEQNDQQTAFYSEIRVVMEGSPNSDKALLLTRCVQVAAARLGDPNTWYPTSDPTKTATYIEQIALTEHLGETNMVEFVARLRRQPPVGGGAFIGNLPALSTNSNFGQPLQLPGTPTNYDPAQSPVPWPFGYTPGGDARDPSDDSNPAIVLYLSACFLQTPCDNQHGISQVTGLPAGGLTQEDSKKNEPYVSSTTVSALSPWQPASSSVLAAVTPGTVWLFYRAESVYEFPRLKVGLPIAGDITNPAQNATSFVSLALPQARRIVRIDAERIGAPPTMPMPMETYVDGLITGTLLKHRIVAYPSTTTVDGVNRVFRLKGEYIFGLNRAPLPTETLLVGRLPFVATSQDSERFNPASIYDVTLGPGAGAFIQE
ncbi:MAG TPA: hypothetical protein VHC22_33985 [Pirellulales bacterium]|nr:hypothetical protein [Pirellulales bacterium]